jgi:hypothetical protein
MPSISLEILLSQPIQKALGIPDNDCSGDIKLLEFQFQSIKETAKKVLEETINPKPDNKSDLELKNKTRTFRRFSLVAGIVLAIGVYAIWKRPIRAGLTGVVTFIALSQLHFLKTSTESQKQDNSISRLKLQVRIIREWIQQKIPTIDEKIKKLEAIIKDWKEDAIEKPESKKILDQQLQLITAKGYLEKLSSLTY